MSKEALIAEWKKAMAPQIDEALGKFMESILDVASSEVDGCIKIVEACRMPPPGRAGPVHTAGWNAAVDFIADGLREWKKESMSVERFLGKGDT